MAISADDLKRHYREMSDGELLSLEPGELTPVAQEVLASEMRRRGLDRDATEEGEPGDPVEGSDEQWVSAGIFRFEDEIEAVLPHLRDAGIEVEVDRDSGDVIWMGTDAQPAQRVLVPQSQLHEAHAVIESHAKAQEMAMREELKASAPRVVTARYEDGVFKPLAPVQGLEDGTEVDVELPR
jgi:hypothetical protein